MAYLPDITETLLRISQIPHRIQPPRSTCTLIIKHENGLQIFYIIKEISRYIFEVAFEAPASCDISDNAVVTRFKKSNLFIY